MKFFGLVLFAVIVNVFDGVYGVDESCRDLYAPVGCFQDKRNNRVMSELILTDRDPSSEVYSGRKIDWGNFPVYLESLACRCARASEKAGHKYFGLQFYGECWSSADAEFTHINHGESTSCSNGEYGDCEEGNVGECVGRANTNFVYKLVGEDGVSGAGPGPVEI